MTGTTYALIDYGFGVAQIWGAFDEASVEEEFYSRANQCFGIRKSITRCVVMAMKADAFPAIFRVDPSEIAAVLKHSGDTIVWGLDGEKIKTEWD